MVILDSPFCDNAFRHILEAGVASGLWENFTLSETTLRLPDPMEADPYGCWLPINLSGECDDGSGPLIAAARFRGTL